MKIGIVNDSKIALRAIELVIAQEKDISIAWTAADGAEAVAKCRSHRPDMILMDIVMPKVDGVEATRQIMQETPCPILIVTSSVGGNVGNVFAAMGAGALDVVATPPLGEAEPRRLLIQKIRSLAALSEISTPKDMGTCASTKKLKAMSCVLIGSSAGGPAALSEIITHLPPKLSAAVVIVQHIDERFSSELASWLSVNSSLSVRLAEEGDEICEGLILIAKGGHHLVFGRDGNLHYEDEPNLSYQPSVDVMFDSAIKYGPRRLLGVVLTGMGRDGAAGLLRVRQAGHPTVAQDAQTSAIYGMPRVAAEMGAAVEILPLNKIAGRIEAWSSLN